MAKYKVGDKVKVGGHTATIVKILGTSASGEQMYGVKQDDNGWAYESLEGKMKAANASFKPGMKVWKQRTGKYFVGEVVKVEGDGISVKWPNGTTENIGSFQMRNIHAMNAKFKVGDRIEFYGGRWNGKPGIVRAVDYSSPNFQLLLKLDGEPEAWYGAKYVKHASNSVTSKNPVVANALNSVKATNAKFKVGDIVFEPTGGSLPTKIIRVFNLPQDEKKMASEFGGDWKEIRADYMRGKTWYNIERDGKGVFYTDLDLKKVTNAAVATNKGIDNPAELRAAADLARALADAKTNVGAALGRFNSTKFADIKWAQSVNKKCDAVAAAINEARTAIQKGVDY